MNCHSLTSTLTYGTTAVQNKSFLVVPDCRKSHLSPLFLCVYSLVSFLCQSGGKFSKYPWQSLHDLITRSAGKQRALWLWLFFHQRGLPQCLHPIQARTWKSLSEALGTSELCFVHTHFLVLMKLLYTGVRHKKQHLYNIMQFNTTIQPSTASIITIELNQHLSCTVSTVTEIQAQQK